MNFQSHDELSGRLSDTARMALDTAERILARFGQGARESGDPTALAQAFDDAGFTQALVPELAGGFGLSWTAAGTLFEMVGRHAAPCLMVESMLAGRLLADAGALQSAGRVVVAADMLHVATVTGEPRVSGTLPGVPWARFADAVLAPCRLDSGHGLVLVRPRDATMQPGTNVAGEARDDVTLDAAPCVSIGSSLMTVDILALGAAARSAQIAGALDAVLGLCLDYAGVRQQFGRPLRAFQVIQHSLAQLGAMTAAARTVSASAFLALDEGERLEADTQPMRPSGLVPVAAAKVYCGEAAGAGAAIAHQIFGAIGFTQEHVLHRYTKRLWSWRDESGSDAFWARRLGERMASAGAEGLWDEVTAPVQAREARGPA